MTENSKEAVELFNKFMKDNGLSIYKVAPEVNTSKNHLRLVLKTERPLAKRLRDKLNAFFGTDY